VRAWHALLAAKVREVVAAAVRKGALIAETRTSVGGRSPIALTGTKTPRHLRERSRTVAGSGQGVLQTVRQWMRLLPGGWLRQCCFSSSRAAASHLNEGSTSMGMAPVLVLVLAPDPPAG